MPYEVISPVTGKSINKVTLVSKEEIAQALQDLSSSTISPSTSEVFDFLKRLRDQILVHKDLFFEKTYLETGFIARDSMEIISSTIEFLSDFETYIKEKPFSDRIVRHSYSGRSERDMRITHRPFRYIAAVVPQNASFTLSIIIIASALFSGSRVILRPSLQCASTGALLAEVVINSNPPKSCIQIINSMANDFLEACYNSPGVDLVHYIGSNRYALPVLTQAFAAGKACILDGQGNGMLYLDDTFPIEDAVRIITSGAIRFNGQTCTSINGVLIRDTVYNSVKEALVKSFRELRMGHPLDPDVKVGPLFSKDQAIRLKKGFEATSNARLLCGCDVEGAYFRPSILEGIRLQDQIVREGFSGPAIWIQPIRENSLWDWLKANRFPLSDTVLSNNNELIRDFARNSRAARICVNEDPTVESMFEPWGGYPPSGLNPVSLWAEKYRQAFQLDGKINKIMNITSDVRTWDF